MTTMHARAAHVLPTRLQPTVATDTPKGEMMMRGVPSEGWGRARTAAHTRKAANATWGIFGPTLCEALMMIEHDVVGWYVWPHIRRWCPGGVSPVRESLWSAVESCRAQRNVICTILPK